MIKLTIRTMLLYLSALLIFPGVQSCKKNDPPAAPKSKTTLLTQASWKLVKVESKTGTGAWIDITPGMQACEKDNNLILRTNNTYESNEGATKCNPADPQIIDTGIWSFGGNETQLNITSGSYPSELYSIDVLNESTLMITYTDASGSPTYYSRYTLGH